MNETTKTLSRRVVMAGVALGLAAPAIAATPETTTIGRFWAEAETLRAKLTRHRGEIARAAQGGIPGWMRLSGEVNGIAEARYGKLIAILNAKPEKASDLAIIAKVSQDSDILEGGRAWAAERLAQASLALAA